MCLGEAAMSAPSAPTADILSHSLFLRKHKHNIVQTPVLIAEDATWSAVEYRREQTPNLDSA